MSNRNMSADTKNRKVKRSAFIGGKTDSWHSVSLSPKAMNAIQRIAAETNSTPEAVLSDSVTLYELALETRKKKSAHPQTPSSV